MTMDESQQAAINEPIKLVAYNASWPAAFDAERGRLVALFPGTFIDIAHIGSTAVPGLVAKPIIDLLTGVDAMTTAKALHGPLAEAGYTTSRRFNAALTDRQWFMRCADGRRTHHLHVVVHGSPTWLEHLRFRDALRDRPDLAERYGLLKAALAQQHAHDRDAYTDAKSAFVRDVLAGAA